MELVVKGKPLKLGNKWVKKAVHFYADALMSFRLHKNIHLTLSFVELKGADIGNCEAHYEGSKARTFDIEIEKSLTPYKLLTIIAHEMVHLKQYAKDELYDYDKTPMRHRFKGEIFDIDDEKKEEYWLSPWEVEAYGSEHGLFVAFRESCGGSLKVKVNTDK